MGNLNGKVALVTGGGTGIGAATALALAAAGAKVAITGRRKDRLTGVIDQISAAGGMALAVQGDVREEDDCFAMVDACVAAYGRLDILINSAGINEAGGTASLSLDQWRRVIETNLMGTIMCCKAALPHLLASGAGDVVNISSTSGRRSNAPFASYATSKFGVNGYTESLRQELGGQGVRVSVVEPGATVSEIADSITTNDAVRDMIKAHVTKPEAMPASVIADTIVHIVSLHRSACVPFVQVRPVIDVNAV